MFFYRSRFFFLTAAVKKTEKNDNQTGKKNDGVYCDYNCAGLNVLPKCFSIKNKYIKLKKGKTFRKQKMMKDVYICSMPQWLSGEHSGLTIVGQFLGRAIWGFLCDVCMSSLSCACPCVSFYYATEWRPV